MKILLIDAYQGAVHRIKNTWLRYLVPISFVLAAKVLAGLFLYHQLNLGYWDLFWMSGDTAPLWSQNEVFWLPVDQSYRWLYLFLGWDSAWYLSIMTRGYAFSSQSYAFFPGLPLFGGLFNLVIKNPVLSIWLC